MKTLKEVYDRYESQEDDTFYIDCAVYHGQRIALDAVRKMMSEAGMITSRLDAMMDEYQEFINDDMAISRGG